MQTNLVAAILGGGAGLRIGGRKALVMLGGKPLAEHVASVLRPAASRLAMIGDAEAADAVGATPLVDPPGLPAGPMSGVCAALEWAVEEGASLVMVAPCDTPLLTSQVVAELRAAMEPGVKVACVESPDGLQPLISMWRSDLAPWLKSELGDGHPAVRAVLVKAGCARVKLRDADVCLNVNTPADLRQAEAILRARC